MPQDSLIFFALDIVPILYSKPSIHTGDSYLWIRLFKFEILEKDYICKLEHLKIVINRHYTRSTGEIFWINAHLQLKNNLIKTEITSSI